MPSERSLRLQRFSKDTRNTVDTIKLSREINATASKLSIKKDISRLEKELQELTNGYLLDQDNVELKDRIYAIQQEMSWLRSLSPMSAYYKP